MEFNSPQPEHAQLHGHIYPKDSGSLFGVLQQEVNIREEQGSASRENSIGNSGTQSMNTAGYDNRGTSNEGSSLSMLASDIGDGQGDGNLIPSPPLSPKLSQERLVRRGNGDSNIKQLLAECKQEIVVTPSWAPGMTSKRYRYATHGFLSQYRLLGYGNSGYSRPKKHVTPGAMVGTRKAATRLGQTNNGGSKSYASGSDFEKVYRTRRTVKTSGPPIGGDAEEMSATELPSRPTPRANRKSKKARPYQPHQHSSAQLASTKDVHSAPTYVPNMSWEKLPDYSPPLSTLPSNNNNKCLKVEWKGSSMDLSQDPLRHKLHPAELVLAQTLRLPCDLYLDSKRRLFCEKVHRLKQGMPFRRTDAQKACRIDVNKASRLFAAYEKIGWLDDDNFAKYL